VRDAELDQLPVELRGLILPLLEGVEGVVLLLVPVELGVQAVEGVIPLPGPALQILPSTDNVREDEGLEELKRGRNKGKTTKPDEKSLTRKMRHGGPPWIHSASFSTRLSKAPWSLNSCHSACSAWALAK
jgi:hypothetical protein